MHSYSDRDRRLLLAFAAFIGVGGMGSGVLMIIGARQMGSASFMTAGAVFLTSVVAAVLMVIGLQRDRSQGVTVTKE